MLPTQMTVRHLRHCLLLLILLVGAYVRLCLVDTTGFWVDEMFDAQSVHFDWHRTYAQYRGQMRTPLHPYVVWLMSRFTQSEFGLRLPDLLFGLLSLYLIYRLVARFCRSKELGLVAGLFVALDPFHIHYSIELRPYMASIMFATLTYLLFDRAHYGSRKRGWLWFALAGAAGLYNFPLEVYAIGACGAAFLFDAGVDTCKRRLDRPCRLAHGRGLLAFLFLGFFFLWINITPFIAYQGDAPTTQIVRHAVQMLANTLGRTVDSYPRQLAVGVADGIKLAILAVGLVGLFRLRQRVLILAGLLTSLHVLWGTMTGRHYFAGRLFSAQWPLLVLTFFVGLQTLGRFLWAGWQKIAPRSAERPRLRRLASIGAIILAGVWIGATQARNTHVMMGDGKHVGPNCRRDSLFMEVNIPLTEPLYCSYTSPTPLDYLLVYFRHLPVRDFHQFDKNPPGSQAFWVYCFMDNDLAKERPELLKQRHFVLQLEYGRLYYFPKPNVAQAEWALALKPVSAGGNLAELLWRMGRYAEAADRAQQYASGLPVAREAYYAWSWLVEKGVRDPTNADTLPPETLLLHAQRMAQAFERYRPDDPRYFIVLCTLYDRLGRTKEGLDLLRRYERMFRGQDAYVRLMGHLYLRLGQGRQAMECFRRCIDLVKTRADFDRLNQDILAVLKRYPYLEKDLAPAIERLKKRMADAETVTSTGVHAP
jgi:hypothetical protein